MSRIPILLLKLNTIIVFLFLAQVNSFSQNYKFKILGSHEGLSTKTIYSVTQDRNGYLWLSTGDGLVRYDGFYFTSPFKNDSISNRIVKSTFRDKSGNLWFGHDDGSVTFYDGKVSKGFHPGKDLTSSINAICEDKKGNIYCISESDGIFRISPKFEVRAISKATDGGRLFSAFIGSDNEFFIGSSTGLYLYKLAEDNGVFELISKINAIPSTKINCILQVNGQEGYFVGCQDEGLFLLNGSGFSQNQYSATLVKPVKQLESTTIESITSDIAGNLWIGTHNQGLFELVPEASGKGYAEVHHFDDNNGLGDIYVKGVFQDREGTIWVATYNNGLAMLSGGIIQFDISDVYSGKNITAVYSGKKYLWLGTEKGIVRINQDKPSEKLFLNSKYGLPEDRVTAFFQDETYLWIGTLKNGIYRMPFNNVNASRFFNSENILDNKINAITGSNDVLYAATDNGIIRFSLKTGKQERFSMNDGLTFNRILGLYLDKNDSLWYATRGNGVYILGGTNKTLKTKAEVEFTCLTADKFGNIWAGSNGNGVVRFQDTTNYTSKEGLKNDYCYAIAIGSDENIWVGHREGVSRINPSNPGVMVYGPDNGFSGDVNQNAIAADNSGRMLFGTTDGLIAYDYSKEVKQKVAPALNIISVLINDKPVDFSKPIHLKYDKYKLQIKYLGINLNAPSRVIYTYRIESSDEDGEPVAVTDTIYRKILKEDGLFVFKIKACNGGLNCNEVPLEVRIKIGLPFWKNPIYIAAAILFLVLAVYVIIKYNEHRHIVYEKKLQKELDERTREVMIQKEEIEIKNRDITDSINYAQRIQASILPSMKRLHERFSGSFIFYQPRDIVSGDFYWFDMVGQDKFMIVCADSTGHGVPGAFMSMIGTTLIKDICMRNESFSPADILRMLDSEIRNTLNQNVEAERSNDGMDIIVCEIDIRSYQVRISSAMRPLIVYRSGEQIYIPGSKCSVGGVYEEKEAKIFEENTYTLSKGDLIYMFSDGYPDQFGGPVGKKFKMVRLRNLLQHIYTKPMDEQYQHVMNNFHLWRGNFEQVDDVLFLGIKI